jgi:hypothetical protein
MRCEGNAPLLYVLLLDFIRGGQAWNLECSFVMVPALTGKEYVSFMTVMDYG